MSDERIEPPQAAHNSRSWRPLLRLQGGSQVMELPTAAYSAFVATSATKPEAARYAAKENHANAGKRCQ